MNEVKLIDLMNSTIFDDETRIIAWIYDRYDIPFPYELNDIPKHILIDAFNKLIREKS